MPKHSCPIYVKKINKIIQAEDAWESRQVVCQGAERVLSESTIV